MQFYDQKKTLREMVLTKRALPSYHNKKILESDQDYLRILLGKSFTHYLNFDQDYCPGSLEACSSIRW
jgi:hypothetical protein